MDNADHARKFQEQDLQRALSRIVETKPLQHTGVCHWCGEDVPEGKLYCDGDCASDHAKYGEHR